MDALTLARVLGTDTSLLYDGSFTISFLTFDTRKIIHPKETLFIALGGSIQDGHCYVMNAIDAGVQNILVSRMSGILTSEVNVFIVPDTLAAFQKIAAYHRSLFPDMDVIGITGSNGKTIVKEWLSQLINDKKIVKSPASYNSQTGVPLSVWQMDEGDQLAIFEAGISQPGEMVRLQAVIDPTLGIFTNIGDAHDAGFTDRSQKLNEKLDLFVHCSTIIYCSDDKTVHTHMNSRFQHKVLKSWGFNQDASFITLLSLKSTSDSTEIVCLYQEKEHILALPFTDRASLENAMHCVATLLALGYSFEFIQQRVYELEHIPMRLEMKQGIKNSILINDTYNADLQSFKIGLEFLSQQSVERERMVILSEFHQLSTSAEGLIKDISALLHKYNVEHVVTIGSQLKPLERYLNPFVLFTNYTNTDSLLQNLHKLPIQDKAILIKGARVFSLDRIFHILSDKGHTAVLETDLQAIEHNLTYFSSLLDKDVKIIAVIKASAYGSGSIELAKFLEYKKVAYVAVAFIDEGITLRKAGISLPMIVLNPDRNGIMDMLTHDLEPEVYSLNQLKEIAQSAKIHANKTFKIHLKIDTGMHRMGFLPNEMAELSHLLLAHRNIVVASVFSHLSSSEDPDDDDFTTHQMAIFDQCYNELTLMIGGHPPRHILNSAGILRFHSRTYEMVRLGLGLYGIDTTHSVPKHLQKVHTLKASIILIKHLKKGEFIGYNRRSLLEKDSDIAVINIGYADGLMRKAGNGRYAVKIRGQMFPIIGSVSMDLSLVDLGDAHNVKVGDDVIIFGEDPPIERLAEVCETIPYEILTRISNRVKRVFIR